MILLSEESPSAPEMRLLHTVLGSRLQLTSECTGGPHKQPEPAKDASKMENGGAEDHNPTLPEEFTRPIPLPDPEEPVVAAPDTHRSAEGSDTTTSSIREILEWLQGGLTPPLGSKANKK